MNSHPTANAHVLRTHSFVHNTPLPAARGPATVRARMEAPTTPETIIAALLGLLRFVATLGVIEVLRLAARRGGEWHLVVHPALPAPWIGVANAAYAVFLAVDPGDLAALSRSDVTVNSEGTLNSLVGSRMVPAAVSCPRTLATLAASARQGARPLMLSVDGRWAVTVDCVALLEAMETLDPWGVEMDVDVLVRPHVGLAGAELLIDGGGRRLWTVAIPTEDGSPDALRVSLPLADAELSADAWPDADHPVPAGRAALVGEVG